MRNITKMLAASALAVAASASQATVYDVTVGVTGTISGSLTGTVSGTATGTFDSATNALVFNGDLGLSVPSITDLTVGTSWAANGLTGNQTYTSCHFNSGAFDLCAGVPSINLPPLTLNTPIDMGLTSNSVVDGNGVMTAAYVFGSGTSGANLDVTYNVTGTPVSSVPVPAAAWLFGSALVGLCGVGRKRG